MPFFRSARNCVSPESPTPSMHLSVLSAIQKSWFTLYVHNETRNCALPRMGAVAPVMVLRELPTGWTRGFVFALFTTSGLKIETLLPVSMVISQPHPSIFMVATRPLLEFRSTLEDKGL